VKLGVAENFRAVFYAPFYALRRLGLAEQEGVEVEWLAPRSPGAVFDEIKAGSVELAWGGPMRVLKDRADHAASDTSLMCFGEVVSRDPFYLVGRADAPAHDLADLPAVRLGVVTEVPTPWVCLQADLLDAGIDAASFRGTGSINCRLTMPEQLRALQKGELDVAQLFEPYVSEAEADGVGRVLYAAAERGLTLYTTFICSRAGLRRHKEEFAALTRALAIAQAWIAEHASDELASLLTPFFPDVPSGVLRASVRRYQESGIWAREPEISRAGFDRLARSLLAARFVASAADYDSCVHNFAY
jgi:NitT/TauT family transport system substrate-binding protein